MRGFVVRWIRPICSASVSSRPRLPGGFVFMSMMRRRSASMARSSARGIGMAWALGIGVPGSVAEKRRHERFMLAIADQYQRIAERGACALGREYIGDGAAICAASAVEQQRMRGEAAREIQ